MPYLKTKKAKTKQVPYNTDNDIKSRKVYGTSTWKNIRLAKLQQQPLCEICLAHNRTTAATDIHHIIPFLRADNDIGMYDLAFDYNNLMSLCSKCHSALHTVAKRDNKIHLNELNDTDYNNAHKASRGL